MLQCARMPELAFVLESMLGFEGSEFYFQHWPELVGKSFYEITCRFDDAIPGKMCCCQSEKSRLHVPLNTPLPCLLFCM
jgi:hypothetical protein